jgi:phenylacetate-CoA ligase
MRRIAARSDDMLTVKGVDVFPAQVEAVLRDVQGPDPQYQIVIERRRDLDEATVLVAVSQSVFFDEMKLQTDFRDKLRRRLASELGVSFDVKLVDRKTLEATVAKGRVVDLRER